MCMCIYGTLIIKKCVRMCGGYPMYVTMGLYFSGGARVMREGERGRKDPFL